MNENYQPLLNINIDKLLNKMLIYVLNHVNHFTLDILISTCGSLVCLKECSSFPTNDTKTLIAVLSLPWMNISKNEFNFLPLYSYLNVILQKYSTLLSKLFNRNHKILFIKL